MMRADLHLHTTASDGRWTPEQIVAGARERDIELIAVTDHDSVANVSLTETLANEAGLRFLRGVEVSSQDGDQLLHILGYGIDLDDGALRALLTENRAKLEATDDGDIDDLIEMGYAIDREDYERYEQDPTRGGWKSLNYLIHKGICTDVQDFFANLWPHLRHQWPDFATTSEVVAAIRAAGGVPVLAHPGASFEDGVTEAGLATCRRLDIAGVECYSYAHDARATRTCVAWCRRHNLLITGGSDYHGGFAGRELGVPAVDTEDLRLDGLLSV